MNDSLGLKVYFKTINFLFLTAQGFEKAKINRPFFNVYILGLVSSSELFQHNFPWEESVRLAVQHLTAPTLARLLRRRPEYADAEGAKEFPEETGAFDEMLTALEGHISVDIRLINNN